MLQLGARVDSLEREVVLLKEKVHSVQQQSAQTVKVERQSSKDGEVSNEIN